MDRTGRGLVPYEIMEITDEVLGEARFTAECNAAYLATVREFIMKNIAQKLADERRDRGMFDALERNAEFDEETDLSMGVSGALS
jgi:DNA-directed RNA polymerase III subunit RPC1